MTDTALLLLLSVFCLKSFFTLSENQTEDSRLVPFMDDELNNDTFIFTVLLILKYS